MIKIQSTTETIESKGGLLLAGLVAQKAGLGAIRSVFVKNAGAIISILFALMVEGKKDFESAREKRGSIFFQKALGLPFVYAKETVRLYLERIAPDAGAVINQLRESAAKIICDAPL